MGALDGPFYSAAGCDDTPACRMAGVPSAGGSRKISRGGEHAALRRGCRAVEAFRGPQDRLHPQTRTVRVSNSLELL